MEYRLEVPRGALWVTDPCYASDEEPRPDLSVKLTNAGGTWLVETVCEDTNWHARADSRVAQLRARHLDRAAVREERVADLGVDAGLMALIPACYVPVDYDLLLARLHPASLGNMWPALDAPYNDVIPIPTKADREVAAGVLSSSGYGDGCYPCVVGYDDKGRPASIAVTFITDDEEEMGYTQRAVEEGRI